MFRVLFVKMYADALFSRIVCTAQRSIRIIYHYYSMLAISELDRARIKVLQAVCCE